MNIHLGHRPHLPTGRQERSDGRVYPQRVAGVAPAKVVPPPVPWTPLGNDIFGDCVFAATAHAIQADDPNVRFTVAQVLDPYHIYERDYDGGKDLGADPSVVEDWTMRPTGLFGYKTVGYQNIETNDLAGLRSAIAEEKAVLLELALPDSAVRQWQAWPPKPWTVVSGSKIYGYHEIALVGYDGWFYGVTWGTLKKIEPKFISTYGLQAQAPMGWSPA